MNVGLIKLMGKICLFQTCTLNILDGSICLGQYYHKVVQNRKLGGVFLLLFFEESQ